MDTSEMRPFLDKAQMPNPESLKTALSVAYPAYQELEALTAAYPREWNHSKQSGWMLKVHDKKKALLYVIPLENAFRVSLTVRESERPTLLQDASLAEVHAALETAKKYAEGYAMAFLIQDKVSLAPLQALLQRLMPLRQ